MKYDGAHGYNVQLPQCPKCRTPIRHNLRYANYIKRQLRVVEDIKRKIHEASKETELLKVILLRNVAVQGDVASFVRNSFDHDFITAFDFEVRNNELSYNEMAAYRNVWTFYVKLRDLDRLSQKVCTPPQIMHVKYELEKLWDFLYHKKDDFVKLSERQQLHELVAEIGRLEYAVKYYEYVNKAKLEAATESDKTGKINRILATLDNVLFKKIHKFESITKQLVESDFKCLSQLLGASFRASDKLPVHRGISNLNMLLLMLMGAALRAWFGSEINFFFVKLAA